jgi:hypothetical protein
MTSVMPATAVGAQHLYALCCARPFSTFVRTSYSDIHKCTRSIRLLHATANASIPNYEYQIVESAASPLHTASMQRDSEPHTTVRV